MGGTVESLLTRVVGLLLEERGEPGGAPTGASRDELFALFRALVNTRPAEPAADELLFAQDEMLQALLAERGVVGLGDAEVERAPLDGRISLWRGDITRLAADAIVNAANSQMLGCWVPGHGCIDNAIHTYAGIQLRLECARLMEEQGADEPTGRAKVTGAWNLPARRVIHTVGPIAGGHPSDLHRAQLALCYASCLDAAAGEGLTSIAFCCISTGVFGFPARPAAEIAVRTARSWLDAHPEHGMGVVFNVFTEGDEAIYRELLW